MPELNEVITEWNARWGHMERLTIASAPDRTNVYAQIGFSSPSRQVKRSHYEFLQERERFSVCFHKEDVDNWVNTSRQDFTLFVRGLEPSILRELGTIIPNISREDFTINERRRTYFWLKVYLSATATAVQACDCMEKLIRATYQPFAEQLGEPFMPEFAHITER